MADLHQVEGTRLRVLELLGYGHAYSSAYFRLRSLVQCEALLAAPEQQAALLQAPHRFARRLEFGVELEWDDNEKKDVLYYIAPVADADLGPG